MPDPTNRELEVFSDARRLPAQERVAFLNQACAGDAALRQGVEELLRVHEQAAGFLEAPPGGLDFKRTLPINVPLTEKPGDRIGHYKLLQQIGEGGCGVVYMAEQEEPVRRRVALKVIKLGMDTKSAIARFEAERQTLALMDHPNIARVLDAGATETGRPYFVMELVRGVKITDHCDRNNLSTRDRLDLFIQVCKAVQHAHQKGIIHRDIKPSNILVTMNEGAPLPKVIDFGIAKATQGKLTDQTVFTAFEQFIGTPAYMSPEQAEMSAQDIDTRSDIYSLGVLLYELLTGQTPFDARQLLQAGLDEIRRTIREEEPVRPSTRLSTMLGADLTEIARHRKAEPPRLIHLVRGDLDWIVMKALEKNRTRRYETANGFAADIQRHLNNEPVLARPPSNFYKFQRLVRRNKLVFAAASAVIAALIIGLVISTVMFFKEQQAHQQAEAERTTAEAERKAAETETVKSRQVAQFLEDMLKGVGPSVALGRDTTMLREILDKTSSRVGADLTNQPVVEAEVETVIGGVYHDIGDYQKAEKLERHALQLRRAMFDKDSLPVANSLMSLARALEEQRKNAEAETCDREALAIFRKQFGDENTNTLSALNDLAVQLDQEGKATEAKSLFLQTLATRRKLLGNDNRQVANTLANLASNLEGAGDLDGAIQTNRECLAILKKLYGDQDPDMEMPLDNLANELIAEKKFAEAEVVAREVLALQRKMLGETHPHLVRSLWVLTDVLVDEGKLADGETLARELVSLQEKRFGNDDPEVGAALTRLGYFLMTERKWTEAETAYRQATDIERKPSAIHDRPELFVWTAEGFADLLGYEGKLPEVETVARELVSVQEKRFGNDDPEVGAALTRLGGVLKAQGKWVEAETVYRQAIDIERKSSTFTINDRVGLLWNLTDTLRHQRKADDGEKLARELVSLQEKRLRNDDPEVGAAISRLGYFLTIEHKWTEAETAYRQATDIERKPSAIHDRPELFIWAADSFGDLLNDEGKLPEAEISYREALEVILKAGTRSPVKLKDRADLLAKVLAREGKNQEADQLLTNPVAYLDMERANISLQRADLQKSNAIP